MYDFCYVISDMLSTTPRAYRSIRTAVENGYSVFLIFNERIPTAKITNNKLLCELKPYSFGYKRITWKKNSLKTVFFKIIHKVFKFIGKKTKLTTPLLLSLSNDYPTIIQMWAGRKIKARVYVGHRPAVLPVISFLAQKHDGKTWFDIEDYHCEESLDFATNRLIQHFTSRFPANFYTDASQLIGKAYLQKNNFSAKSLEILNSPIDFVQRSVKNEVISFLWFSQYISFNRGLELFFEAIKDTELKCELHLVGNLYPEYKQYIDSFRLEKLSVHYHGFIPENKINELAQNCDFGLALELPNQDVNKNIAVSNKILTYAVSGCFIIATKTKGQLDFMQRIPENGVLIEPKTEDMKAFLMTITTDLSSIREKRNKRIAAAQIVKWEVQKNKLSTFMAQTLSNQ